MTTQEILNITWIYLQSLGPAILVLTVIFFAEELLFLLRKAISLDFFEKKDY